jgi:UDP-glucose 4-epimerase
MSHARARDGTTESKWHPRSVGDGHVLITGAAGFFGRAIVRALAREQVRVLATDRVDEAAFAPRPGTPRELVEYVQRDIEQDGLEDLVKCSAGVVYAAALTPVDETAGNTADRLLRVNLQGFVGALTAVRDSDSCRRVLFVSSAGVYHQAPPVVLREEDADGGTSLYGAAKLAGELVGRRHAALFGREFCAVRPTSLIGPGEEARPSRPRVTPFAELVSAAREARAVRLEARASRADLLAVDDAAEAVALLWRTPQLGGGSFNVSSARPRSAAEVAAAVSRVAGLHLDDDARTVVHGGSDRAAKISNERLLALGWRPRRTLEDIVREVLDESARVRAGAG